MSKSFIRWVFLTSFVTALLLTASLPASADSTGFHKESHDVFEVEGFVRIDVVAQWCCPAGQGQVDYYTSDLTAAAESDYLHTAGTLTFAGGGSARISVPILNDEMLEGEEQFQVTLTNFRGTFTERGSEKAIVKIIDDDADPLASDPAYKAAVDAHAPPASAPAPKDPATPAPPATTAQSEDVHGDAPAYDGYPFAHPQGAPAGGTPLKDEEGESSRGVFLILVFLTLAAAAFGLRR